MPQNSSFPLTALFDELIAANALQEGYNWMQEKKATGTSLHQVFTAIPRKLGKQMISISDDERANIHSSIPGWRIDGWTVDRLARVWLLMTHEASDQATYIRHIENLFPVADVNELVALYSALPVLQYPESWSARCSEGIRSNIGDVLQSIMCNSPYPSEHLDEAAWNQMVLKAFFTDKPVEQIVGLDARANERLAYTLSDYAHERWSAGRTVNPLLWRCMAPFINEQLLPDIIRLFSSPRQIDREAAALACSQSQLAGARASLEGQPDLATAIGSGWLTWKSLAEKKSAYVL